VQVLFILQTAFSIWMLVDAIKRGAQPWWWIIIMVPFGEFVYFFMIKIHDPPFSNIRKWFKEKPVTLEQLRYEAQTTPSVANKVRLAQGLYDHGDYGEAIEIFEEMLAQDPEDKASLYGLGACRVQQRAFGEAIPRLEQVVDLELSYKDYLPAMELCNAYWQAGRKPSALALLERVARHSRRLEHELDLARCLAQLDRKDAARELLQQALADHEHSPAYVQRQSRPHARAAKALLRELG